LRQDDARQHHRKTGRVVRATANNSRRHLSCCRFRFPHRHHLTDGGQYPQRVARKAWLFSDSVPGADASAVIYSLMLTCRACDVEPYTWLRHVLTELPKRQAGDDVTDLLPFNSAKR